MNRTYELEKQRNKMNGQKHQRTEPKIAKQQEHRTEISKKQTKTRTIKEEEGRRRESSWRWMYGWMITPLGG